MVKVILMVFLFDNYCHELPFVCANHTWGCDAHYVEIQQNKLSTAEKCQTNFSELS